jgi:hypothetical protein
MNSNVQLTPEEIESFKTIAKGHEKLLMAIAKL